MRDCELGERCAKFKANIPKPPTLVYLAFAFSGDPTENTKKAREMALILMTEHPDWFVIVPHYTVDALLDGTLDWRSMTEKDFSQERRRLGGVGSLAFVYRCDILILGCDPTYGKSSGVTWEWISAQLLNQSYRKDNPIEILYAEDLLGEKRYKAIMEGLPWK